MSIMILRGRIQKKHLALKRNFIGREFDLMDSLFKHFNSDLGLTEIEWAIPHVNNFKISSKDIENYHRALMQKIEKSRATKILVMGTEALQIVKNGKYQDVYRVRGQSWTMKLGGRSIYFVVSLDPEEVAEDPGLFPDLLACVRKFFEQDAPYPPPKLSQWLVETSEELGEALDTVKSNSIIACDTETTGLDPLKDTLITLGFCIKDTHDNSYLSIIVPKELVYNPDVVQTLYEFFLNRHIFVFHNAKFDVKWLQVYLGLSFFDSGIAVEDTMLMNYVLDERTSHRAGGIHGLKTLSRIKFDAEEYATDFDTFFKIPEEKRDYPALYQYLSKDLVYTYMLFEDLEKRLGEGGFLEEGGFYYDTLIPAALVMTEVELKGVMIDIPYLQTLGKTYAAEIERIKGEIQEYLFTQVEGKEHFYNVIDNFNPGSPAKILKVLTTVFGLDGVAENTARETLQNISQTMGDLPVAHFCEMILDYREFSKILSTYVTKLIASVDENQRVHGNFNLNGTTTGRLSSDNPNLQNIPRGLGAAIRKAFIVPEGYTFVNADYSQLEIRVAATLSKDTVLIDAYKAGRDIHRETASKVFKVPYDDVTSEQRTITKRLVFGILYGISAYGMVHTLAEEGIIATEKEAQEYIDSFLGAFPGYNEWRHKTEDTLKLNQEVKTIFGRVRRWPYLNTVNQYSAIREAVNMPIQSTASDICLQSIINLHGYIKDLGGHIIFTVHDSIVMEIPTDKLDHALTLIKSVMEHPNLVTEVPFEVDIKCGERWSE